MFPSTPRGTNQYVHLGDVLEIMEQRHDWAQMIFTPELFKYVFTNLLPEVIMHSQSQDEEQVRGHYDRGDDFYEWLTFYDIAMRFHSNTSL